ncbi:MAG: hypothetical protein AAF739_11385 [Pseudomonadota bacterium]
MQTSATTFTTMALRAMFRDWYHGQIKPVPFALLFPIAMAATYLTYSALLDALSNPAYFDRRAVASASQNLGLLPWGQTTVWMSALALIGSVAAGANLMAKRIRDMGLPGGLAVCMLAIIIHVLISGGTTLIWLLNAVIFASFVALLAIPTDHLEAGSGRPRPRPDRKGDQQR